jgi:hypothetical protein
MIEVLRLSVENIRAYLALREACELHAGTSWNGTGLPRLEDLHSAIAKAETLLAKYETDLPRRPRARLRARH